MLYTITYDTQADAVYVKMSEAPIDETVQLNDNLVVDYDGNKEIVGVEILQ